MAEDDPDDRFLMEQAFMEIGNHVDLRFVEDGEELMHYLLRSGKYTDRCTLSATGAYFPGSEHAQEKMVVRPLGR